MIEKIVQLSSYAYASMNFEAPKQPFDKETQGTHDLYSTELERGVFALTDQGNVYEGFYRSAGPWTWIKIPPIPEGTLTMNEKMAQTIELLKKRNEDGI